MAVCLPLATSTLSMYQLSAPVLVMLPKMSAPSANATSLLAMAPASSVTHHDFTL